MNHPYLAKVLPSVFRNFASTTEPERHVMPLRANADLLRKIASRALSLDRARIDASADSIASVDFAAGALVTTTDGVWRQLVHLQKVSFDCGVGRRPRIVLEDREGRHYALLEPNLTTLAMPPEQALPMTSLEVACHCGMVSFREALAHPKAYCIECGAPGHLLLENKQTQSAEPA